MCFPLCVVLDGSSHGEDLHLCPSSSEVPVGGVPADASVVGPPRPYDLSGLACARGSAEGLPGRDATLSGQLGATAVSSSRTAMGLSGAPGGRNFVYPGGGGEEGSSPGGGLGDGLATCVCSGRSGRGGRSPQSS